MKTIKLLAVLLLVGTFTSCSEVEEEICVEDTCYEIIDYKVDFIRDCWDCRDYETTYYVKDVCSGEFVYFKSKGRNWEDKVGNTVYCGFAASNWTKSYFNN